MEFFISSFLFEDAGVTGYRGAIRALLELGDNEAVDIAAGLLAVESYHAGVLRGVLSTLSDVVIESYGVSVGNVTSAATGLINSLFQGEDPKAIGLATPFVLSDDGNLEYTELPLDGSVPTIAPVDNDYSSFSRNTSEILKVVYLGSTPGGFYPQGFTGAIA